MTNHYDEAFTNINRLQADRRDLLTWLHENAEEMEAAITGLLSLVQSAGAVSVSAPAAPKPERKTPIRGARRSIFLRLWHSGSETQKNLTAVLNLTPAQVSSVVSVGRDNGHFHAPDTNRPGLVVLTERGIVEANWFSRNGKVSRRGTEQEAQAQ